MSKRTILKYSLNQHKQSLFKRTKALKENKLFDGMNSFNTNVLKINSPSDKQLQLKPIQHPDHIYEDDSNIVSYKVPPKNLTPYY